MDTSIATLLTPSERATRSLNAKKQSRDSHGHFSPVGGLTKRLSSITPLHLHQIIPRYHWFNGTSGLLDRSGIFAKRIHLENRPWLKRVIPLEFDPLGSLRNKNDQEIKHVLAHLSPDEREVLHRVTYGDIPASWGHDPAYIQHLREWSEGNKLVDKDGLPYRLFHGTGAEFHRFKSGFRSQNTHARDTMNSFFFTSSPEDAGYFAAYGLRPSTNVRENYAPQIYPVHVRLKNPLYVIDHSGNLDMSLSEAATQYSKDNGYDGVVIYRSYYPGERNDGHIVTTVKDSDGKDIPVYTPAGNLPRGDGMVIAAHKTTAIKSAIGNNGDFNPKDTHLGKSFPLVLEKSDNDASLQKKASRKKKKSAKSHPKVGDTITYQHPNYPTVKRQGKVLATGTDGCLVFHQPSGIEEKVRHEHIVRKQAQKTKEAKKELTKSIVAPTIANVPIKAKNVEGEPKWNPVVVSLPYEVGHAVSYKRPDMSESRVGRIDSAGKHGAVVSLSNGARHKVRWAHIEGHADAGFMPGQRGEAVDALTHMGIAVDPLEKLLTPLRGSAQHTSQSLGKVEALGKIGTPVDVKHATTVSEDDLDRLLHHLTGTKRK